MFLLRLLGGATLEGPDGPMCGRVAQRRQLGLLAFLAVQGRRPSSRDKLLALFWPDADTDHARRALADTVYLIRKALGHESIRGSGDDLWLDPGLVQSDVAVFEDAVARGDARAAAHAYSGPLLDGFHLAGAPDFDHWMEQERVRLAEACCRALEDLAGECEAAGDRSAGADWLRRAAELQPDNSRLVLRLSRTLATCGQRVAALLHLRSHARVLVEEYGVDPDPEIAAAIDELRRAGRASLSESAPAIVTPPGGSNRGAEEGGRPPSLAIEGSTADVSLARHEQGGGSSNAVLPAAPPFESAAPRAGRPLSGRWLLAVAAVVVVVGGGLTVQWRGGADAVGIDERVVVALPFRTAGAAPALWYLREGMVELLAATLGGAAAGIELADPGAVLSAWRRTAVTDDDLTERSATGLAREMGASRFLLGSVVGTPSRLSIHVSLIETNTGTTIGRATVHGTEAGLPSLVDRLVAELLSRSAGEDEHRLAHLTSTSLPALRTFLEARAAHRRGDYEAAIRDYGLALDLDPEFALAGLGILQVTGWVGGSAPAERRGREVARQHHARLSERDRAGLGDAFFEPEPRGRTARDHLEAREEALRRWPHHPRLWYSRGDLLFHLGGTLGVPSWPDRARESFERAIELDPDFAEPVHHLASQLFRMGDTAALRRLTERQLTRHRSGPVADYLRWLARHALDDASTFGDVALEVMDTDATLRWIGIVTQDEGFGLEDGARAVNLRLRRPGIRDELFERRLGGFSYALNGGRPVEALQHLQSLTDVQPDPGVHLRLMILSALYADGDAQAAEHAALALSLSSAGDPLARLNACVLEQWRAAQASSSGARADSRPMVDESEAGLQGSEALLVCTWVLEALRAASGDSARRQDAVERLDRLMAEGPNAGLVDSGHTEYAHLALARLHESAGDAEAALAAVRRRATYNGWQPYLAAMLRQEGRLAEALEDFDGAARAYRHYLAFRTEPEPSMAADVEAVRVSLRSIETGSISQTARYQAPGPARIRAPPPSSSRKRRRCS